MLSRSFSLGGGAAIQFAKWRRHRSENHRPDQVAVPLSGCIDRPHHHSLPAQRLDEFLRAAQVVAHEDNVGGTILGQDRQHTCHLVFPDNHQYEVIQVLRIEAVDHRHLGLAAFIFLERVLDEDASASKALKRSPRASTVTSIPGIVQSGRDGRAVHSSSDHEQPGFLHAHFALRNIVEPAQPCSKLIAISLIISWLKQRNLHTVGILKPHIGITPWGQDGGVDQCRPVGEQALHCRFNIRHLQSKPDLSAQTPFRFDLVNGFCLGFVENLKVAFPRLKDESLALAVIPYCGGFNPKAPSQ